MTHASLSGGLVQRKGKGRGKTGKEKNPTFHSRSKEHRPENSAEGGGTDRNRTPSFFYGIPPSSGEGKVSRENEREKERKQHRRGRFTDSHNATSRALVDSFKEKGL